MRNTICFFLFIFYCQASLAQQNDLKSDTIFSKQDSLSLPDHKASDNSTNALTPYHTSLVNDGLIIAAAAGVNFLGYELIKNKKNLTMNQLSGKTRDKLPFFDRGNAGYYSPQADRDSYILFTGSYAIPVAAALLNKKERTKFGQIMAMYFETMAITGSMYTITAGLVYRSRPFVYGNKAPLEKRLDKGAQRSFYGGHVATTAAATFFTAKVFSDFNPGSKLTPWLYGAASGLTVAMGYFRYRSGYHFLSDCMLSGAIGIATGILVPQFHKNKNLKNISLTPAFENNSKGFLLTYRF
jgi:membrane-associated phospholipid phosphatase